MPDSTFLIDYRLLQLAGDEAAFLHKRVSSHSMARKKAKKFLEPILYSRRIMLVRRKVLKKKSSPDES